MADVLTGIYLIADTPEHISSQNPGQPSSTMRGYQFDAQDGEDIPAIVARVAPQFGLGTTLIAIDTADVTKYTLATSVEPVTDAG